MSVRIAVDDDAAGAVSNNRPILHHNRPTRLAATGLCLAPHARRFRNEVLLGLTTCDGIRRQDESGDPASGLHHNGPARRLTHVSASSTASKIRALQSA